MVACGTEASARTASATSYRLPTRIETWDPRPNGRERLVRVGTHRLGVLGEGDPATEESDDVSDHRRTGGDREHRHVHRDPASDGDDLPTHFRTQAVGPAAEEPIRVAAGDGRDRHRSIGPPGTVVAHR